MVDIPTKGATLVIVILGGSWGLFGPERVTLSQHGFSCVHPHSWLLLFITSFITLFASIYIYLAVVLYSGLLNRAVGLGKNLDERIFSSQERKSFALTTNLDEHYRAGGKHGPGFYRWFAGVLYVGTAVVSWTYLWQLWVNSPELFLLARPVMPLSIYAVVLLLGWVYLLWEGLLNDKGTTVPHWLCEKLCRPQRQTANQQPRDQQGS